MENLGFGLDDDSGTRDQVQTDSEESSHLCTQRYIQSLLHACQCRIANCEFFSCQKMKRVVQHAKSCKRQRIGGCPICKHFIALCCLHTKHCQEDKCIVPFCLNIKHKLRQQQLQLRLQQARILKRRIATMTNRGMLVTVMQQSPGNSNQLDQPLPSPQPHSSHTPQPEISMEPSTCAPAYALQAVQQVQAAVAHPKALPMVAVATASYGKGLPFMQPVPGKPSMMPTQQQMQAQMQMLVPQITSNVLNCILQGIGGLDGSPYAQHCLQGQPPPPQQAMGLHQATQHMGPFSMPSVMGNAIAPMVPPPGLPSAGPSMNCSSGHASQQLLQTLNSPVSEQQRHQVFTILKSNPHLLAAFIKQRSTQKQQQEQQQMIEVETSLVGLSLEPK